MPASDGREAYYSTVAPLRTVPATCEEVDCEQQREGFVLTLPLMDENTELRTAVVHQSDRRHAEFMVRQEPGGWVLDELAWNGVGTSEINTVAILDHAKGTPSRVFAFPPGERCFTEHRVGAGTPVLLYGPNSAARTRATRSWRKVGADEFTGRLRETTETVSEIRRREGVDEMVEEASKRAASRAR